MAKNFIIPLGRAVISKYLVVSTHFDDNLEKATLPWVVANTALAEGKEVAVFLQGKSVKGVTKGGAVGMHFEPFPPIADLINAYLEGDGKVYLCSPCMKAHGVTEDQLLDGPTAAGAAFLIDLADGPVCLPINT